eukprot:3781821-Rhodomonas_salina.1
MSLLCAGRSRQRGVWPFQVQRPLPRDPSRGCGAGGTVQQLMRENGGNLGMGHGDRFSTALCEYAYEGNLENVTSMLVNGVDPTEVSVLRRCRVPRFWRRECWREQWTSRFAGTAERGNGDAVAYVCGGTGSWLHPVSLARRAGPDVWCLESLQRRCGCR